MARHDHILISPSRGRLVEELVLAQTRANEEVAILDPLDHHKWEAIVRQLGEAPEGRQQWSDSRRGETARIAVSWWTDHIGRRHFRVIGGNSRDGSYRFLSSTRTDTRPALWHLYPDRLFWHSRGERSGWVAVCGCGEVGPPAKLGWMGQCCAVCYDRAEEGDVVRECVPAWSLGPHRAPPRAIAFSPEGRQLACVRVRTPSLCWVRIEDVYTDAWRELPALRDVPQCVAFSPDGEQLAYTEGESRLLLFDLERDEVILDHTEGIGLRCLAFSPDGRSLAVGAREGLYLWQRNYRGGAWHLAHQEEAPALAVAWSANSDRLAAGGYGTLTVHHFLPGGDRTSVSVALGSSPAVWDLRFVDEGRRLVCLSWSERRVMRGLHPEAVMEHVNSRLQVCDLATSPPTLSSPSAMPGLTAGQLSGDGTWLAWAQHDEMPLIHLGRMDGTGEGVRIGWDLEERIVGLCFSPDGQTLAAQTEGGTIKLVPWRLLV